MSLLLFAVVSSPVSTRGSFKVSSYLVKDVLYQADTLRSSVSTEVFVLRSGSPLSPSLYIIPSAASPSVGPARAGPSGVSLLNEISAPLTRALVLSPSTRRTGMTSDPWICEQPPSSSKWRPRDGSRPCLSREDGRREER